MYGIKYSIDDYTINGDLSFPVSVVLDLSVLIYVSVKYSVDDYTIILHSPVDGGLDISNFFQDCQSCYGLFLVLLWHRSKSFSSIYTRNGMVKLLSYKHFQPY